MPALLGPVLGPPIGGFIVTYFSWRLIFDINIPIGILGITLVTLFIEDIREPRSTPFDWRGFFLSGIGLAALMFGLETIGRGVVPRWVSFGSIAAGLVSGALYAWHARIHPRPLIDLTLFRIRTFSVAVGAGTMFRIGIGAIPFLLPMMLQLTFGQSAAQSGLITFASSLGALVMKPVAVGVLRRMGFRNTLVYNAILSAILLGLCASFAPTWPVVLIYAVLLSGGFFRSLQFTAYNALAYADVPRERMSSATSFYSAMQQISLTLGVSAAAASLTITMALSDHTTPLLSDFSSAFIVVALISLCSAPLALTMPRNAAAEMSGHRRVE
jgi:MFS family permease